MGDGYFGECQCLAAGGSTAQTWVGEEFVLTIIGAAGHAVEVRLSRAEFDEFRWQGANLSLLTRGVAGV